LISGFGIKAPFDSTDSKESCAARTRGSWIPAFAGMTKREKLFQNNEKWFRRHSQLRSGFSLMELAIVLGVFGLILGGLWSIVSTVKENVRRERAFEQTILIVKNIRAYYQALPNISGSYASLTPVLATNGIIPFEMLRSRTAATLLVDHPWGTTTPGGAVLAGGGVQVCDNTPANCTGPAADSSAQTFAVRFNGLSYGACINLLARLSSPAGPPGLVNIVVNSGTPYLNTAGNGLPVSMVWSDANCSTAKTGNTLDFIFRLRQQTM
jgi:prepilin-type N-terminal cleavage/methylation domain-containing protein